MKLVVHLILFAGMGLSFFAPQAYSQDNVNTRENPLSGHIFISCATETSPLYGIIALDPSQETTRTIVETPSVFARVSPDGRLLALSVSLRKGPERSGLWVYPTAGQDGPIRISLKARTCKCWSPDSKSVITDVVDPGQGVVETWRVSAEGLGEERLPLPKTEIVQDWSLDGKWLFTLSTRKSPERGYYLMHPDGSGERFVTVGKPVPVYGGELLAFPRFSPTSQKVLFEHVVFETPAPPFRVKRGALMVFDVKSGQSRRFFEFKDGVCPHSACWSPDGKMIAACVREDQPEGVNPRAKCHVEIVDQEGRVQKKISLPGSPFCHVLDWR